ncbi:MAG: phospholipid carrier-dependent glycosyltransferase [Fimbriimonadales bacterium]|nr:phospholipid carrier-dependent glycosyltransferase [Fimbriimonadales bacterium]
MIALEGSSRLQRLRLALLWVALFAVALSLRLVGIRWSLPTLEHHYTYHPDEWLLLAASYYTISPQNGEFLPGFYNYGTLPMYLWNLWLSWLHGTRVIEWLHELSTEADRIRQQAQYYLWGRVLVALLGAGAAVIVGRTLAMIAGVRAGIVAGLAMALAPALVVHSRFMTVDVPTMFFVALTFHQAVALTRAAQPLRSLLWGAVWAGCAAGSKYNAGLALIAPLVSLWLLDALPPVRRALWSAAAIGVAGATFVVVCPGVWADSERFWAHFWYEVRHVSQGHGEVFTDTGLGWVYHLTPNLSTGFGVLGLVASVLGWVYGVRLRVLWGILAASLAYYLLIGAAEVRFLRYTFPLFPALAMGIGLAVQPPLSTNPIPRGIRIALTLGALLWQLASAMSLTLCMVRPDARDQAAAWIRANLPQGTRIGFPTVPWFYTPPLFPQTGELHWQQRLQHALATPHYRLVVLAPPEWDADALRAAPPEYLIISEFEERDVRRIGRADYQAFVRIVNERYTLLRTFSNEPPLLGRREQMPHDLLYICPRVKVYRLR